MRKARGLVIAPFDSRGERVLDTVRRALTESGVEVLRLDDMRAGALWVSAITEAIRVSDFLVVDVTRQNPNVLYELGYAHALRKPTILMVMSESDRRIPSDLNGLQYIVYDPSDLSGLAGHVKRAASAFIPQEAEVG